MPVQPLICKYCQGVFLPASGQPWSAVQCPHCSGQMQIGECAVADAAPAGKEQVWQNVTEEETAGARQETRHRLWSGRMVFLACALPLLVLAAWGVQQSLVLENRDKVKATEQLMAHSEAEAEAERLKMQKAVQQFLTAPSWDEMLPAVADAERVKGVIAWYYQEHRHQPRVGNIEVRSVVWVDGQGRERRRALVVSPDHAPVWLLTVKEDSGWKVDWEVFSGANAERWHAFLHEPAGTSVELPLLVALKPAADAYIIRSGQSPDSHGAVVMWAMERHAMAAAVLDKHSPLWLDLPEIGFENAVKVIARVTVVDPRQEPPLVKLERIVTRGWLR